MFANIIKIEKVMFVNILAFFIRSYLFCSGGLPYHRRKGRILSRHSSGFPIIRLLTNSCPVCRFLIISPAPMRGQINSAPISGPVCHLPLHGEGVRIKSQASLGAAPERSVPVTPVQGSFVYHVCTRKTTPVRRRRP